MKKLFFLSLIFFSLQKIHAIDNEKIAFFVSPKNWEIINPKTYPPFIEISLVKKEISTCRPTLNLATQKTNLSLEEYTNEAKKNHITEPNTVYKILEKINLPDGAANICLINKNTNSIDFEILQMIFVKNYHAYVLTGACRKEEMLENYKIFMNVFTSFRLIDDIFSLITDPKIKDELIYEVNKMTASCNKENKKNIASFEKYIDKKFAKLGKYFQILLIKKYLQKEGL
jgi:hypothetical protein